jgi:hypothetical protein
MKRLLCRLLGCDAELRCWRGWLASGEPVSKLYMECRRCERRWWLED